MCEDLILFFIVGSFKLRETAAENATFTTGKSKNQHEHHKRKYVDSNVAPREVNNGLNVISELCSLV